MALLGGTGPAVIAGLCAFAALGYAIYQVNTLFTKHPLKRAEVHVLTQNRSRLSAVQIVCHLRHYNGPVYQVISNAHLEESVFQGSLL